MLRKLAITFSSAVWLLVNAFLLYTLLLRRDLFLPAIALAVLAAMLLIVGVFAVSLLSRLRAGMSVFPPQFQDALFHEQWVSGRGHQRLLFQRPAASRCLWVAVLPDRLVAGVHFPFNLLFIPERLGLECDISADRILSVTERQSWNGRVSAGVRFRSADGKELECEFAVRDADRFYSAMAQISKSREEAGCGPTT